MTSKEKALFRMRRYARTAAKARLQGNIRNASRWDDEIEKVYADAKRHGWNEDPFVAAEEKGRHEAERLVRSGRDRSKGKKTMAGRPKRRRRLMRAKKKARDPKRRKRRGGWYDDRKGHATAARKGARKRKRRRSASADPGRRRDPATAASPRRRRRRRHHTY